MIGVALSGLLLLLIVFGGLAVTNCTWQRVRDIWRDLSRPLP